MKRLLRYLPFLLLHTFIAYKGDESTAPSSDCPAPEVDSGIKAIASAGEERFKIGDILSVRFSADVLNVGQVLVLISDKDGSTFKAIVENSINVTKNEGTESFTQKWRIPADFITESSKKIKIRVSKYIEATLFDVSDSFTINPIIAGITNG